ncbi:hypothetical protein ASPNIDRAFT_134470, partial [Aspergillus niger ATCC 1015]
STARHSLGLYFNVAVSATYILPDTFTLPLKDYVYKACETLIGQHPILSAIPVNEDTEDTWFVRLPEIDLSQSVAFQRRTRDFPNDDEPDVELCELLQVQHSTGFTAPLPFWRLYILTDEAYDRRFTAVYVFHHAIGDGTSGKAFHQTAKVWSPRDSRLWTGAKISAPIETKLRQIVIPAAVSAALRKNCRQNNATVTSALQAAVARALFTHLPEKYTRVQMNGALSCRRWLKGGEVTDQSMGVWVMDFGESFYRNQVNQYPDTFPWGQARKSRTTIEQALGREGKNAGVCLLKYIDNFQDLFGGKIGKNRNESFEVSNVGILQPKQAEDPSRPQIKRAMFSQTPSALGAALHVSSITGGDGCLILGITWQTGIAEPELVNAVIDTLIQQLH